MKTKTIGIHTWHDAMKLCNDSNGEYRLPTISELNQMCEIIPIPQKSFWSCTEYDTELAWTGAVVEGQFWQGDNDHDPTSKNNEFHVLVILK